MIDPMRVAIITAVAIALVASGGGSSTGAARGHAKHGQLTYRVYFPTISVPRDAGISSVRVVVTCGHVAAVTRIPDDWYVRTLLPAHESGPEWADFQYASNAVEFGAALGVARVRNLKSFDGAIKLVVEKARCFDVVADLEDDMTDGGWKTRLRKSQLHLRH
jgi:hypothetical protein